MMADERIRAKVFISCGQRKGPERAIADKIKTQLEGLGYEGYVATEQQSLDGVRENIFRELESSEYFVFIDFKRERLDDGNDCRGSLFSHQELAIASHLGLEVIAFQEDGVKPNDGLLPFIQANPTSFTDRANLHTLVVGAIQSRGWNPQWKNQLQFMAELPKPIDAIVPPGQPARFFGVPIKNLNPRKAAVNCFVYLEQIYDKLVGEAATPRPVELYWSGYTQPNALIRPDNDRWFDAFLVYHKKPSEIVMQPHTGSTLYVPRILQPGDYELTYVVESENFTVVKGTLDVHLGERLDEIRVHLIR